MKITESQLRQLIDEEITLMVENGELDEGFLDRLRAKAAGLGGRARAGASRLAGKAVGAAGRAASAVDMGAQDQGDFGAIDPTVGDVARSSAASAEAGAEKREKAASAKELAKIRQLSGRKLMKAKRYLDKLHKDISANIASFESDEATDEMVGKILDLAGDIADLSKDLEGAPRPAGQRTVSEQEQ